MILETNVPGSLLAVLVKVRFVFWSLELYIYDAFGCKNLSKCEGMGSFRGLAMIPSALNQNCSQEHASPRLSCNLRDVIVIRSRP